MSKTKVVLIFIVGHICLNGMFSWTQPIKRPFTVADEIGLTLFDDFAGHHGSGAEFSPDGDYLVVASHRGRLDLNCPEGSLRFYRSQDIDNSLKRPEVTQPPQPVWEVNLSPYKEGPIVTGWRWLADSSGVAFLERTNEGNRQLMLADLRKKMVEPLTSTSEAVLDFDIRDREHYVYLVTDPGTPQKPKDERHSIVGTGRSLYELLWPADSVAAFLKNRGHLWAVIADKHFEVKMLGARIDRVGSLALSPDGISLVTRVVVSEVPSSWATLYPPPFPSDPRRFREGNIVHQWVRIELRTGSAESLTDAPESGDMGGWADTLGSPTWSSDGQEIILPGTFLKPKEEMASRPCIALISLSSNERTCVEMLKARTEAGVEEGFHFVIGARFVAEDNQRIRVVFEKRSDWSLGSTEYRRAADGSWRIVKQTNGVPQDAHNGVEVAINQSFRDPPLLVASKGRLSRVIWDPNPQLKEIELGKALVYTWKSRNGLDWRGGLYLPNNYTPGQRYPLVIQTHNFTESEYRPSGVFPTAFAARALASAHIMVLQVDERCPSITPGEGSCAVSGYETAAKQLVSEGLVDPERIGIIGFSRTCFYVMETLTGGSLPLRAASITDGVMEDYWQYMILAGDEGRIAAEADQIIGAKPFGEGLRRWFDRSPGFNVDKVTTPLLVTGGGPANLLFMWAPYAALHYLNKPVELIMLNTDEHVLTNPAVRMASQGGSVDWFRFWLQGYEDPDPAKTEQYARWRELKKLQEKNEKAK